MRERVRKEDNGEGKREEGGVEKERGRRRMVRER